MRQRCFSSHRLGRSKLRVAMTFALSLATGCASEAQLSDDTVTVAPFQTQQAEASYALLEEQIFRYANRFSTRIALAADQTVEGLDDPAQQLDILRWRSISISTMINLAIGPDAVTNLLDTIVVTTLSRVLLEDYWVPETLGEADGALLLDAYEAAEEDIWEIADQVLTEQEQRDLLSLITDWHAENPDQLYPWGVRLDEFSGQRAARLRDVQQSGGLLGIREAARSISDLSSLTERIMFFLENMPLVTRNSVEQSYIGFLQSPQLTATFGNLERFVAASEEMVATFEQLPDTRFEVVTQIMDDISLQRAALFDDVESLSPETRAIFGEARLALESLERILLLAGANREQDPNEPGFDIQNYVELAVEAATAARELETAITRLEQFLGSSAWDDRGGQLAATTDRLEGVADSLIIRLTLAIILVIVVFFVSLLAYRVASARISRSRRIDA